LSVSKGMKKGEKKKKTVRQRLTRGKPKLTGKWSRDEFHHPKKRGEANRKPADPSLWRVKEGKRRRRHLQRRKGKRDTGKEGWGYIGDGEKRKKTLYCRSAEKEENRLKSKKRKKPEPRRRRGGEGEGKAFSSICLVGKRKKREGEKRKLCHIGAKEKKKRSLWGGKGNEKGFVRLLREEGEAVAAKGRSKEKKKKGVNAMSAAGEKEGKRLIPGRGKRET